MPIKSNGYSNTVRLANKARRRAEGIARNAAWAALSPKQQLAELDRRGVSAKKQRARIMAQIEEAKNV